jgi:hypothetical protein
MSLDYKSIDIWTRGCKKDNFVGEIYLWGEFYEIGHFHSRWWRFITGGFSSIIKVKLIEV